MSVFLASLPLVCKWGWWWGCRLYCLNARLHTYTQLFLFYSFTQPNAYKQRHNLRHIQLHLTRKQIKPPSVSHTHKEPTLHSYADRNLFHHPPLLFSSKFTGLINVLYSQYGRLCLVHCVLYSQLQIVNMTVKSSVNTLFSYHSEASLTAQCTIL